jgi:uncharacterized protein (DUF2267 family)
MKLSKETLKRIIKEELEASLSEMIDDEIDHSPLDDLMGDPLSPEEKKQADERYQKSLAAEKIVDAVFDFMDKGMSKEEIIQILKSELDKY